jgi:hypothetical protein
MRRPTNLALVVLALAVMAPAAATASIGTGVGALPLVLHTPAKAGHTYSLPPLYVKNTGTVTSLYTVKIERIGKNGKRTVPASWVHVHPAIVRLRPGVLTHLEVTVDVPADAPAASYTTDLVATTTTAHAPGATALGAAAADSLSFEVPPTSTFPWLPIGIAAAVILLLGGGWWIRRSDLRPRARLSMRGAQEPS